MKKVCFAAVVIVLAAFLACFFVNRSEMPPDRFAGRMALEDDGGYRIGVRCSKNQCVYSVYEVRGGIYHEILSCEGLIGPNGLGKVSEGDGKTPQGTFRLGNAYGIKDDPGSRIPYTKITSDMYWISSSGPYYNTMRKDGDSIPGMHRHDERLIDYPGLYDYLIDIGYNPFRKQGLGSAVFLHCLLPNVESTWGGIAIPADFVIRTLQTVTPGTSITIY